MNCPHCGHSKSYRIVRGNRRRCASPACRRDFSSTSHTVLRCAKKPLAWYAEIIRLHEDEGLCPRAISRHLGMKDAKSIYYVLARHKAVA